MKIKMTSVLLLCLCFAWLAVLSGAVPVLAKENEAETGPDPSEEAAVQDTETIILAVEDAGPDIVAGDAQESTEDTPAVVQVEPETEEVATDEEEEGLETPAETQEEPLVGSDVSIIPTTITADGPLENDTYYDVDPEGLLSEETGFSLAASGYQILIIHTHATEAYTPEGTDIYEASDEYRTTDINYSVVRVGEELATALSAYGLNVLHDTGLYDYPSYNGSYVRSGEAIEEYLAAYPSIWLVIDLHRDALGSGDTIYKTVTDVDGVTAAQMLFVMGSDVNLEHPYWQENLKLALLLQDTVTSQYPELMRSTVLCDYRYNQQLTTGSLLLEVGTAGNTLQEALTAVDLFAEAVGPLLASFVEQG